MGGVHGRIAAESSVERGQGIMCSRREGGRREIDMYFGAKIWGLGIGNSTQIFPSLYGCPALFLIAIFIFGCVTLRAPFPFPFFFFNSCVFILYLLFSHISLIGIKAILLSNQIKHCIKKNKQIKPQSSWCTRK